MNKAKSRNSIRANVWDQTRTSSAVNSPFKPGARCPGLLTTRLANPRFWYRMRRIRQGTCHAISLAICRMHPAQTTAQFNLVRIPFSGNMQRGAINPVHGANWQKECPFVLIGKGKKTISIGHGTDWRCVTVLGNFRTLNGLSSAICQSPIHRGLRLMMCHTTAL